MSKEKKRCSICGEELLSYGGAGLICCNPCCENCPEVVLIDIYIKEGKVF